MSSIFMAEDGGNMFLRNAHTYPEDHHRHNVTVIFAKIVMYILHLIFMSCPFTGNASTKCLHGFFFPLQLTFHLRTLLVVLVDP
jgi:hypothetical protein